MGSTQSVSRKVNFEDIQYLLNKTNEYILINTLDKKDQDCLIKNTILIQDEEKTINHFMKNKIDIHIIIYDKNANVPNLMKKYEQLIGLGFTNVYIYPGVDYLNGFVYKIFTVLMIFRPQKKNEIY